MPGELLGKRNLCRFRMATGIQAAAAPWTADTPQALWEALSLHLCLHPSPRPSPWTLRLGLDPSLLPPPTPPHILSLFFSLDPHPSSPPPLPSCPPFPSA